MLRFPLILGVLGLGGGLVHGERVVIAIASARTWGSPHQYKPADGF